MRSTRVERNESISSLSALTVERRLTNLLSMVNPSSRSKVSAYDKDGCNSRNRVSIREDRCSSTIIKLAFSFRSYWLACLPDVILRIGMRTILSGRFLARQMNLAGLILKNSLRATRLKVQELDQVLPQSIHLLPKYLARTKARTPR